MSEMYSYGFGAMANNSDIYVVGTESELDDRDIEHSIIFERNQEQWTGWSHNCRATAVSYARTQGIFFLIGQNGSIEATTSTETWDETIDASNNGPSSIRSINCACTIGQHLYTAGMRRQVYRRNLESGHWSRFDAGCIVPNTSTHIAAFNCIHGFFESEIFAAGLKGEIWCYRDNQWAQIDSPTNTSLYSICQLKSGEVLAGGAHGVLLRGGSDGFAVVPHDNTDAPITGIAEFSGKVFIADEQGGIFTLAGDQLMPVPDVPVSDEGGGQLDANDSALIYVRTNSAFLFNGTSWQSATPPDESTD